MMIGPEPIIRILLMSSLFGIFLPPSYSPYINIGRILTQITLSLHNKNGGLDSFMKNVIKAGKIRFDNLMKALFYRFFEQNTPAHNERGHAKPFYIRPDLKSGKRSLEALSLHPLVVFIVTFVITLCRTEELRVKFRLF